MRKAKKLKTKVLFEKDLKNKIAILVGTRPGIIKMSPLIKEAERQKINHFVIHAGQHYSYNMDKKIFEDLDLPRPKYHLANVKKCSLHGEQTAEMLKGIEKILIKERPKAILVCADANFNLAGALAARKLRIKIGHVESGLRSNQWEIPEEHNRVMIDHISDWLFAPTQEAKRNLIEDNVKGRIVVTGNTIVDALNEHFKIALKKSKILQKLNLKKGEYFLVTIHREENVDRKENLKKIIKAFQEVRRHYNKKIIFPAHPRTVKMLRAFELTEDISAIKNLLLIEPLGYLDFIMCLSNAFLVLTDSGGIQEESCILKIPCVTLREKTERPETIKAGANVVAGIEAKNVLKAIKNMENKKRGWHNPFGNGKAAKKIIDEVI